MPSIRVAAGVLATAFALVVALNAFAAAAVGMAASGVEAEDPPGHVISADSVGFAWRDGIRTGQTVVTLQATDDGPWSISTVDATGGSHRSGAAPYDATLDRTLPLAGLAVILAILGFGLWTAALPIRLLSAIGAALLAIIPLTVQGEHAPLGLALVASAVVPVIAVLIVIDRRPWQIAIGAALAVFMAVWWITWPAEDGLGLGLETARSWVAIGSTVAAFALNVVLPVWRHDYRRPSSFRWTDLVPLVIVGAVAVPLVLVVGLDPMVVVALFLVVVLAYPVTRRRATASADRLVLAPVRETAAIEATERERMRVASELHDSSMQDLSGVIRRLERLPEAAPEREALQQVAAQLRGVATGMRPPMLDDLGLVPALGYLAERASRPNLAVGVHVDETAGGGPNERRAPDVELELYRICEEAVNNAVAHARASRIEIAGFASCQEVRLRVWDDGVGMTAAAMDAARRAGRMGMASMRRRAASIGATLGVSSEAGTIVEVSWHR